MYQVNHQHKTTGDFEKFSNMSNSFRYLTSTDTDQQQQEEHTHRNQQQQPPQTCTSSVGGTEDTKSNADTNKSLHNVPDAINSDQHDNTSNNQNHAAMEDESGTMATTENSDTFNQNENSLTGALERDGMVTGNHQQMSPGLSLLQAAAASSPPPHSYRHSRAYRHFKNPPQPHMCIRTTTEAGEELFINVLSWTRIVIPQEPSDPIPLYGGMRVPPGSPRSPPIVFAVMANPEVLKDSGRHSKDPEERRAMVELMCDFVEAMNPGVKLVRNAVILKDRDISGELKDVWNAVQAQRDREREEQMMQQRQQQQQQHYHNLTTNGGAVPPVSLSPGLSNNSAMLQQQQQQQQQIFPKGGGLIGNFMGEGTPPRSRKLLMQQEMHKNEENGGDIEVTKPINLAQLAEHLDNKAAAAVSSLGADEIHSPTEKPHDENHPNDIITSNGNNTKDSTDSNRGVVGITQRNELNNQLNANNLDAKTQIISNGGTISNGAIATNANNTESNAANSAETVNCTLATNNTAKNSHNNSTPPPALASTNNIANNPAAQPTTAVTQPAAALNPPPTTKKEKLGGFLPNGCIFPRFTKNNKHKDKDKEGKTKDKEKNVLLSALKKSKDKKSQAAAAAAGAAAAAAANANHQDEKQQKELINTSTTTTTSPISITTANTTIATMSPTSGATLPPTDSTNNHLNKKNCLQQLECEVQKLDLNHIDGNTSSSSSSTANMTATSTSNNSHTGVGVH